METFRRLAQIFYARVTKNRLLLPLFPKPSPAKEERLALFLAETFGGPKHFTLRRGKRSLQEMHASFPIEPSQITAWKNEMYAAVKELGLRRDLALTLRGYFCTHAGKVSDPLREFRSMPLDQLQFSLQRDPTLANKLIRDAAGGGDAERVRLLLDCGADPNAGDLFGHTPLYFAANRASGGESIARMLIQHGADIDARSGPTKSAPLHVTARRDNVAVAETLLDAGAKIEVRDYKGQTALRRAINCRQPGMIAFLISKGANLDAPDHRGETPRMIARKRKIALPKSA
jgi:hemoglobin